MHTLVSRFSGNITLYTDELWTSTGNCLGLIAISGILSAICPSLSAIRGFLSAICPSLSAIRPSLSAIRGLLSAIRPRWLAVMSHNINHLNLSHQEFAVCIFQF